MVYMFSISSTIYWFVELVIELQMCLFVGVPSTLYWFLELVIELQVCVGMRCVWE